MGDLFIFSSKSVVKEEFQGREVKMSAADLQNSTGF